MFKYTYRPNSGHIAKTYKFHTGVDIFENGEYEIPVELVVIAANEEECLQHRIKLSDITHWELFSVESL